MLTLAEMKMNPNNGKGSKRRPKNITQNQFDKNWDKIFKNKKNGKL